MTEACTYYLSDEASSLRLAALVKRLASEALDLGPVGITFPPESDFWKVPTAIQATVLKELHS